MQLTTAPTLEAARTRRSGSSRIRVTLPAPRPAEQVPVRTPEPLPPSADFSLSGLRGTDTMGALDDCPAPVGQLFQEELCMQRLHALLVHEIRWLRRSGARELDLVLKPDAATRIALHVWWSEGRFQAEAQCREGDFHMIHVRWDALQEAVVPHGLLLGPLLPPPARLDYPAHSRQEARRALPAAAVAA